MYPLHRLVSVNNTSYFYSDKIISSINTYFGLTSCFDISSSSPSWESIIQCHALIYTQIKKLYKYFIEIRLCWNSIKIVTLHRSYKYIFNWFLDSFKELRKFIFKYCQGAIWKLISYTYIHNVFIHSILRYHNNKYFKQLPVYYHYKSKTHDAIKFQEKLILNSCLYSGLKYQDFLFCSRRNFVCY